MNTTGSATGVDLPHKIIKDGLGVEHKVIDLENKDVCPRHGTIIFEATTRKNKIFASEIPFRACQDKATGVWIGIPIGIDRRTKEINWLPITLGKREMFNREIKDQAEKAAVLLRSNIVEGSPNLSDKIKLRLFRVYDPEIAAQNKIRKIEESIQAVEIAKSLYGEKLMDMARVVGIDTKYTNATILMSAMLEMAHEKPKEFLNAYNNPNREKMVVFNTALQLGVITHDIVNGYFFNSSPLGTSAHFACEYFEKHPEVMNSIRNICKQREAEGAMAMKPRVEDAEKEQLRKENEALKRMMAEKQSNESQDNLENELTSLKTEAESLGIKPLHVYKATPDSISKLKAKIAEKESV